MTLVFAFRAMSVHYVPPAHIMFLPLVQVQFITLVGHAKCLLILLPVVPVHSSVGAAVDFPSLTPSFPLTDTSADSPHPCACLPLSAFLGYLTGLGLGHVIHLSSLVHRSTRAHSHVYLLAFSSVHFRDLSCLCKLCIDVSGILFSRDFFPDPTYRVNPVFACPDIYSLVWSFIVHVIDT